MAIKFLDGKNLPWRVYWRNPYTRKIETKHFAELLDAEKHDAQVKFWIKHEPEQLRPVVEEAQEEQPKILTVDAITKAYLADIALKPKSLRDTLYHLKAVSPSIGKVPVPDLTEQHMVSLVDSLRERGLKANGINRKVGIVTAALNWAKGKKIIPANPVLGFKCSRGKDAQIPPPSETEIELILAASSPHIIRVIVLGWHFGMRVGESEMFALQWSHVDLKRGSILVWSAEKNDDMQWRELRVPEHLLPLLKTWREQDDKVGAKHVINYRGKPVTTIKRAWKRALERAGITRTIRPYDLRHAHATQALAHGADIKAVSQNMGHADTTMIHRHYQHVLVKQRDEALAVVPNLVIQSGNTGTPKKGSFGITEKDKP
jgi:integrase